MKNYLLFFLLLLGFSLRSEAQNLIARHSEGEVSFYEELDAAIDASATGDTLYLPGGTFTEQIINKSMHIFGAGYHPDSTTATIRTQINGSITVTGAASNGSIQGLYITGDVTMQTSLTNYSISRCYMQGSFDMSATNESIIITQNIFSSVEGGNSENNFIIGNVIYSDVSNFSFNNIIRNNIFLSNNCQPLISVSDSHISNNIFTTGGLCGGFGAVMNNIFENNIYLIALDPCVFYGGTNVCNENINSVDEATLFEAYTDGSGLADYFSQDLGNKPGSPAIDAGSDGSAIGIYGGMFPWKEGGLPVNPHIQSKTIDSTTDADGGLQINIKVAAQDE